MLDGIDCDFELQVFEGGVVADFLECVCDVCGHGVGAEGLDYAAGGGVREVGFYAGESVGVAGEEGDGEVAVGGVGQDAGYAGALARLELLHNKASW